MKGVIRTCIGCRGKFLQNTLIRFVAQTDGTLRIDNQKKLHGRGAYVCRAETCILKAFKAPKRINALLRAHLANVVIEGFEITLLQWIQENPIAQQEKKEVLL